MEVWRETQATSTALIIPQSTELKTFRISRPIVTVHLLESRAGGLLGPRRQLFAPSWNKTGFQPARFPKQLWIFRSGPRAMPLISYRRRPKNTEDGMKREACWVFRVFWATTAQFAFSALKIRHKLKSTLSSYCCTLWITSQVRLLILSGPRSLFRNLNRCTPPSLTHPRTSERPLAPSLRQPVKRVRSLASCSGHFLLNHNSRMTKCRSCENNKFDSHLLADPNIVFQAG